MTGQRPYLLDFHAMVDDEASLTWKATREFCQRRVAPVLEQAYEQGKFPRELIPEFAEMGFLGASLSGYGCAGLDPIRYGLVNLELERQDSGIRSFCSVQSALAMYPIHAFGSEEQKQRWLPEMAAGRAIGCFGLTEPNAGSNPSEMSTHARQSSPGGDFVLHGQKMWITNSPIADVAVVWAQTQMAGSEDTEVRGFLVERGMPGFTAPEIHGKLSLRASLTGEIVLDEVRVPEANLLPGVRGLAGPLECLTQARFGIGWGVIGAAMDVYERALNYGVERRQFGRPIAGFQLSQDKLVEMHNSIAKSFLLALHLGQEKREGRLDPIQVCFLKRDNVRMALECARTARSMLGGNGIMGEFHIMRHLCNLETVYTYEGTHEIHTLAIGRALTGLAAFE